MDFTLAMACAAAWTFVAGMFVGINLAERRLASKPTIDKIFEEGVCEIRSVEKFAGLRCISRAIITDLDGSVWRMSIEREEA